MGRGLAGYVVVSGQSIAVADVHRDERFDAEIAVSTGYVPTSILAVAVEDDDGPIGGRRGTGSATRRSGHGDRRRRRAAGFPAVQLARSGAEVDTVLADDRLQELVVLVRRFSDAERARPVIGGGAARRGPRARVVTETP